MFSLRTKDLDIKKLKDAGIKHVLFDLDGTIYPLGQRGSILVVGEGVFDLIFRLREADINVYVVSNTSNAAKVKATPYFHKTLCRGDRSDKKRWKPWRMAEALKSLGIKKDECCKTIMVGNNLLNDGLGAKLCGIKFCFVLKP